MNSDTRSLNSHGRQLGDGQISGQLHRIYAAAPKMKTVNLEDDEDFRKRVRHVLKPSERLAEFTARTGLGSCQAKTLDRDQITRFVANAERNRANEPAAPPIFAAGVDTRPQGVQQIVMVG